MRIDKVEYLQKMELVYEEAKKVIEEKFSAGGFQDYSCDGIINVDSYNSAKHKIAFVLSESYGKKREETGLSRFNICEGDSTRAARQLGLSNNKIKATRRIAYLAYLMLNNDPQDSKISKYPSTIDDSILIRLQDSLNSIVYLNVKKALRIWTPEKTSKKQSNEEVKTHAEANKEVLKNQLDLSNPEIVIICGNAAYYGLRRGEIVPKLVKNSLTNHSDGRQYLRLYHPSAPGKWSSKYMLGLCELVKKELELNQKSQS